jgi:hypothetical protein
VEVIKVLREIDERGEAAVAAAAEVLALPEAKIRVAMTTSPPTAKTSTARSTKPTACPTRLSMRGGLSAVLA